MGSIKQILALKSQVVNSHFERFKKEKIVISAIFTGIR